MKGQDLRIYSSFLYGARDVDYQKFPFSGNVELSGRSLKLAVFI